MKAMAQARAQQGYTKVTPARCGTCANISGEKCGIGGFPVARYGVCLKWQDNVITQTEKTGKVFPRLTES